MIAPRPLRRSIVVVCVVSCIGAVVMAAAPAARPAPGSHPHEGEDRGAAGDGRSAAELLPASTVFYAELNRPAEVYRLLLDHPLRRRVEELPQVRSAVESNAGLNDLIGMVRAVEGRMQRPWRDILETVTSRGLYVAVDPATKGLAILARSAEPATTAQLVETFIDLARQHAEDRAQPDPIRSGDYRGVTGHRAGQGVFTMLGPWLVITNSDELTQRIVDAWLGSEGAALASDGPYLAAQAKRSEGANGWAYLRVRLLRDLGVAKGLFGGRSDNPGAELLVGGVLAALRDAEFATAELHTGATEVRLAAVLPHDPRSIPAARRFFFAPAGEGAPRPLRPEGTILSISAYRDVAALWNAAPDLFGENVATRLAQADANLGNFFGGRAFGADILPAIDARFQWLAVRETFEGADHPAPAIKLPSSALIFSTHQPQLIRPMMKVAFQTLIGFANIQGAMQGRPPLLLSSEPLGDVTLVTASYQTFTSNGDEEADETDEADAALYWNFTPTLALIGERLILSSSRRLAEHLVERARSETADRTIAENTLIELHVPPAIAALQDNREQLIAQNMLQQGHSREEAERQVGLLLEALGYVRGAKLRLVTGPDAMWLEADVELVAFE